MLKKLFVVSMFLFFTGPALAIDRNDIDLSDLTEAEKVEVLAFVESKKSAPVSVQELGKYAELGEKYGKAIVAVAKELGVSADEVLKSTSGKIALGLVIWKIAGDDLFGLLFGSIWFLIMIPMWVYFYRRICLIEAVKYTPVEGQKRLQKYVKYCNSDDGYVMGYRFFMLLILVIICGAGFVIYA